MKKSLLALALCLILVVALVACNDPEGPGADSGEVTTEAPTETKTETTTETPTEAPTTEVITETPTEEVTTEPEAETPSEEVTTEPEAETPTEEVTTEPEPETSTEEETTAPEPETSTEEETTEPEPETSTEEETTEPPVDPNAPVHTVDPAFLENYANQTGNLTCNQHLGACEVKTEGGRTFFRMTTAGNDPYIAFIDGQKQLQIGRYMAISYRTDGAADGQFFMGSGLGWTGQGDCFMQSWVKDGQWNLAIIDLDATGMTALENYVLNYARLDFFTEGQEGKYFDVEYIGFFNSVDAVELYDYELHKAPMWDADKAFVKHQNFDQLYKGTGDATNGEENLFAPGASGTWDGIADLTAGGVDALTYWGWIGYMGELGQFGYQIDRNAPIYNADWAFVGGDHEGVISAAQNGGADSGHRMKIAIDLAGLEGDHTVRTLYKTADGTVVCLGEFTVKMPVVSQQYIFDSDVASNFANDQADKDLKASDLASLFDRIYYGAGKPVYVKYNEGNPFYHINDFTAVHTRPDGWYAYGINVLETSGADGFTSVFVRGYQSASNEKHFFGQDGNDNGGVSMGGAGIYLNTLPNGMLRINVKTYENGGYVPNVFSVRIDSKDLVIADNGSCVYILAGGKLVATVEISGTADYGIGSVEPDALAATAIVTLADGTVAELNNACVAATVTNSDLGIATRTGSIKFDRVFLKAFSDVEIPEFEQVEKKINVALNKPVSADSVQNDDYPAHLATDGNEATRWGAVPNGLANLVIDLEGLYALTELEISFESALWAHQIAVSEDGEEYTVIYEGEAHGADRLFLETEVNARYIKVTRLEDDGVGSYWFSIYELYAYGTPIEEDIVPAA